MGNYPPTPASCETTARWMSNIDDDVSVGSLSIPGTHNTMSFDGYCFPIRKRHCQSWSLYTQLEAGIRFLDLQCRYESGTLHIESGMFKQHKTFQDVIVYVIRFLDANPTETVFIRVTTRETGDIGYLNQIYSNPLFSQHVYEGSTVPKLGNVRGKFIMLCDVHGFQRGVPSKDIDVFEDSFIVTLLPFLIKSKWKSLLDRLKMVRASRKETIFLTYTNGASHFAYPIHVSMSINPELLSYISESEGNQEWGIVAMDFPTADLVKQIIDANFK